MEALKLLPREELLKIAENSGYFEIENGKTLRWVSWVPKGMKVLVVLVHGLGEHVYRYQHWASFFCANKIGVIGIDMRGHGKSAGRRGDSEYFNYLKDIKKLLQYTQEQYPFTPKVLYGHSMGGNLVMRYAIEYRPLIAGVISSSPWLRLYNPPSEVLLMLSKWFCKFMPFLTVKNGLPVKELSHDKNIQDEYASDPLVHDRISLRLFTDITDSGRYILRNKHKVNTPLLIMHGSGDKITSYRASNKFKIFTSDNTTMKLWKDAYHELHNEFEKVEIFQYILQWIERLPSVQQHL